MLLLSEPPYPVQQENSLELDATPPKALQNVLMPYASNHVAAEKGISPLTAENLSAVSGSMSGRSAPSDTMSERSHGTNRPTGSAHGENVSRALLDYFGIAENDEAPLAQRRVFYDAEIAVLENYDEISRNFYKKANMRGKRKSKQDFAISKQLAADGRIPPY